MIERLVIFGATGDLTARYLLPGLAGLRAAGELGEGFAMTAAGREGWDGGQFRSWAAAQLDRHAIVSASAYRQADVSDPGSVAAAVAGVGPAVAYLALPPAVFPDAVSALREAKMPAGSRVALEKPFGEDLASAESLNRPGRVTSSRWASTPRDRTGHRRPDDMVCGRPRPAAMVLPWLYYLCMTRVLLAEDDSSISEPLSRALRREGYQVEVTEDGLATLDRALSEGTDLILLDIGLPELDGLEVCRRVRAEGHAVPVLILTARADEVDTVVGLDAGADDYVTKPFRLAELLARVRALLRRGSAETPGIVRGVRVDAEARRAWHGDTELDLTTKEFDLLWILLRDAGKVVTREQIMREVWDAKWWTSTKTLDMHISWLRRKLGDDAHHPRYITTVRGVGFRFERGD